jgi:hypothetical protein
VGNFSATFQVTDSLNVTAVTPNLNLVIASPVGISTSSLASGNVGTAYSVTLVASGGTSPYTWALSAGTLPAGLTLNATTGKISGSPSASGTSNLTVKVTDNKGAIATKSLSLTINTSAVLGISTSSLASGTINKSYSTTLAETGGASPYTWTLAGGSLPPGLTLSPAGIISGIPTATGTYTATIKVTDKNVVTASKSLSLTIKASTSGTSVDIKGTIGAINTASKYITVGGVNIYYNSTTSMLLNTDAAKITTTGSIPAGVIVGMAIQGKGNKDTAGKISASSLEFN